MKKPDMKIKLRPFSLITISALVFTSMLAYTASADTSANDRLKDTVTPIKEVQRGQHVLVEGTVDRIRDTDEFVLSDDTGRVKIYIGWKNRMPVSKGEAVKVWGVVDDDFFPGLRPEIYAYAISLASGEIVHLTKGD
jgi:uncharacterized protein YdeI (BOF family)